MSPYKVGDIISIHRYEDRDMNSPSAIGVVLKVYADNRFFVKLLNNYHIPRDSCKNWKRYGIKDMTGYYVRSEDFTTFLAPTCKTTYIVSSSRAYASKITTDSSEMTGSVSTGYVKTYDKTHTEVYTFVRGFSGYPFDDQIPTFVMMRDLTASNHDVETKVVVQRNPGETLNDLARKAYAMIQISKFERVL